MAIDQRDAPGGSPDDQPERRIDVNPRQERRILLMLGVVAGTALILGIIQFKNNLSAPFNPIALSQLQNVNQAPQDERLIALQAKDTDQDGLTDYDELYKYSTSPYIPDSDSDGRNDGEEIEAKTDPNCPTGKTCSLLSNSNAATSNANAGSATNTQVAASSQVTAAQLREALIAAGASKTELDAIDDATLMENYAALVAEESANSNVATSNTNQTTNSTSNTNVSPQTVSQLQNLSIAEIRSFLSLGGVPAESLDKMDDDTLRAIYQQALQETLSTNTNAS
ncbi:MAG: hypothetical protein WCV85_05700 [Patescibacteria group bacterium]|jgi:hypothetical protein